MIKIMIDIAFDKLAMLNRKLCVRGIYFSSEYSIDEECLISEIRKYKCLLKL